MSNAVNPLTPREQEVAFLLTQGLSNPAIAQRMGISVDTVKEHVGKCIRKLQAGNRTGVATWFIQHRPTDAATVKRLRQEGAVLPVKIPCCTEFDANGGLCVILDSDDQGQGPPGMFLLGDTTGGQCCDRIRFCPFCGREIALVLPGTEVPPRSE